ncbi:hypothetical protein [Planctellipticum variicoloris]|jgi:hypothetical protein|uniref:hypothetical protein n=1 Tax=Planctellipticum variicoloris TaxID=3064265 RepID=UPI002C4A379E|nr:hypothetical protein SH412_000461 [Planctomycetaceae bacterium SH412]HTN04619.1 hypothetical protein [Planctomycetaceae bacterium]
MKRLRNIAAIALVAGIAVGVWLADWFKGLGSGDGIGIGQRGVATVPAASDEPGASSATMPAGAAASLQDAEAFSPSAPAPKAVSLIINDRAFFLRTETGDQPVTLQRILQLASAAPGDEDGHRLKIARTASSRPSTEIELQDALKAAGIPDKAIYWKPGFAE